MEPRVQPGGLGEEELLISLFLKGVQWEAKKSQIDGGKRDYLNKAWQTPSLEKRKIPL